MPLPKAEEPLPADIGALQIELKAKDLALKEANEKNRLLCKELEELKAKQDEKDPLPQGSGYHLLLTQIEELKAKNEQLELQCAAKRHASPALEAKLAMASDMLGKIYKDKKYQQDHINKGVHYCRLPLLAEMKAATEALLAEGWGKYLSDVDKKNAQLQQKLEDANVDNKNLQKDIGVKCDEIQCLNEKQEEARTLLNEALVSLRRWGDKKTCGYIESWLGIKKETKKEAKEKKEKNPTKGMRVQIEELEDEEKDEMEEKQREMMKAGYTTGYTSGPSRMKVWMG